MPRGRQVSRLQDEDLSRFDTTPAFDEDPVAGAGSLRDQVRDALRAAVIAGRMKPGALYSAPALSEMLGVSATPVREAMLDLVAEDLVVAERNRGFRVTSVSDAELDALVEARLLLEVPVMGAVAEAYVTAMDPELERLRDLAQQLEAAAVAPDVVAYLQLDTEFHTAFLALHGNAEIVRLVRRLRGRSRLYGLEALARSGRLTSSTREHRELIDLVLARDRPGTEALTRTHLSHARSTWAG